jgi:hypothetical protein
MIWFNNENFLNESWGFFLHYNYWSLRMLTSQNGISFATYDTPNICMTPAKLNFAGAWAALQDCSC